jgi:hypothetical protein
MSSKHRTKVGHTLRVYLWRAVPKGEEKRGSRGAAGASAVPTPLVRGKKAAVGAKTLMQVRESTCVVRKYVHMATFFTVHAEA